jgi:hypothetical protein
VSTRDVDAVLRSVLENGIWYEQYCEIARLTYDQIARIVEPRATAPVRSPASISRRCTTSIPTAGRPRSYSHGDTWIIPGGHITWGVSSPHPGRATESHIATKEGTVSILVSGEHLIAIDLRAGNRVHLARRRRTPGRCPVHPHSTTGRSTRIGGPTMAVVNTPAATATRRRVRRQLLRGLFRPSVKPEWEPQKLPRGVTEEMVEQWLADFTNAKAEAEPWITLMEQIRALLDDVPSGVYGTYKITRHKPRRIMDQKAVRVLLERLGEVVPWTSSKAPVKVRKL